MAEAELIGGAYAQARVPLQQLRPVLRSWLEQGTETDEQDLRFQTDLVEALLAPTLQDGQHQLRVMMGGIFDRFRPPLEDELHDLEPAFLRALRRVTEVVAANLLWTTTQSIPLGVRIWLLSEALEREDSARVPRFILLRESTQASERPIALPVDELSALSSAKSIDRGYSVRAFGSGEAVVLVQPHPRSPTQLPPNTRVMPAGEVFAGNIKASGLRSWIDVPLCPTGEGQESLGKLSIDLPNWDEVERWADSDVFPVEALRRLGSLGYAGLQALRELQLELLRDQLRRHLVDKPAKHDSISKAREHLSPLMRLGGCWVLGQREGGFCLLRVANPKATAAILLQRVDIQESAKDDAPHSFVDVRRAGEYVGGLVFASRTPMVVNNVNDFYVPIEGQADKLALRADPHGFVREVQTDNEHSFACVPLIHEGSAVGTLAISATRPFAFCGRMAYVRAIADALGGYVADFREQRCVFLDAAISYLPRTTDLLALDARTCERALCLLLTSVTMRECEFQFHRGFAFSFDPATLSFLPLLAVGPLDAEEWERDSNIDSTSREQILRNFDDVPDSYRKRKLWRRCQEAFPYGLPAMLSPNRPSKLGELALGDAPKKQEGEQNLNPDRFSPAAFQKQTDHNRARSYPLSSLPIDDPLRSLLNCSGAKDDYDIYFVSIPLGGVTPSLWLVLTSPFNQTSPRATERKLTPDDLTWGLLELTSSVASSPRAGLIPEDTHNRAQLVVGPDGRVLGATRAYKERYRNAFTGPNAGKLHARWPSAASLADIAMAGVSTYVEGIDLPPDAGKSQQVDIQALPLYFEEDRVTTSTSLEVDASFSRVPAAAILDLTDARIREARANKATEFAQRYLPSSSSVEDVVLATYVHDKSSPSKAPTDTSLYNQSTLSALGSRLEQSLTSSGVKVTQRKLELLPARKKPDTVSGDISWDGAASVSAVHLCAARSLGAFLRDSGQERTCSIGGAVERQPFSSVSAFAYESSLSSDECVKLAEKMQSDLDNDLDLKIAFPDAVYTAEKLNCASEVHVTVRIPEPDSAGGTTRQLIAALCRSDVSEFISVAEAALQARPLGPDETPDLPRLVLLRVLRRARHLFTDYKHTHPARDPVTQRFCALAGRVVAMSGDPSASSARLQGTLRHFEVFAVQMQRNNVSRMLQLRLAGMTTEPPRDFDALVRWCEELAMRIGELRGFEANDHEQLGPSELEYNELLAIARAWQRIKRRMDAGGGTLDEVSNELARLREHVLVESRTPVEARDSNMQQRLSQVLKATDEGWLVGVRRNLDQEGELHALLNQLQATILEHVERPVRSEEESALLGALDRRVYALIQLAESGLEYEAEAAQGLELCIRGLRLLDVPEEDRRTMIKAWFQEFARAHFGR